MSTVEETVVFLATTFNSWTATESPAHLGIINGVDTPNDAQYLHAGTVGKIFFASVAAPVGTGYDRISKVKMRIRLSANDTGLAPGLSINITSDGNSIGFFSLATDTDGAKKVLFADIEGLDIAEADAGKFIMSLLSSSGVGADDPNFEEQ